MLRPYAVACLAGIAALQETPPQIEPPLDIDCREHLARLGLYEFFDCPSIEVEQRETNVPIQQITDRPGSIPYDAAEVWAERMGGTAAKGAMGEHLDEVVCNALVHAASPVGCIMAGQAFPNVGLVEVAILDLGQTIRRALAKNPAYRSIYSDNEAIELATQETVTGIPPGEADVWGQPHSGAGLYELRDFCESGGGVFSIVSGYCIASYGVGGPIFSQFHGGFRGTLVNVCFFTG